jgi:hypothetical protein
MAEDMLIKKEKNLEFLIAIIFIIIGISLRLMPHPANFTPITAIALFAGAFLSKKIALAIPLLAMVISDFFIGFYDLKLMSMVYGSFILCVIIGFLIRKNKKSYTILGSSIMGTFIFFFLTNFSFWAFTPFYTKTLAGLIQCYTMALPFLKNSLLGDLTYVIIFFGTFAIANVLVKKWLKERLLQRNSII